MTDALACYGCGAHFERALLEEVGDTVFCRACLARMLRRADERRGRPDMSGTGGTSGTNHASGTSGATGTTGADGKQPGRASSAQPASAAPPDRGAVGTPAAAPADAPCFVCGGSLEGPTLFELRGFAICGSCARSLIGDEAPATQAADVRSPDGPAPYGCEIDDEFDDEFDDDIDDDIDDDDAMRAAPRRVVLPEGSTRVVATPGSGTEWCSGCGRAMPGPGSYQLVGGRPTCAACVARTLRSGTRGASAEPRDPGAELPDDEPVPADRCEACRRAVDVAAVPETQGFRLCAACLHSDPELALAIARSRHQRRLARAGRRLLDGDDD